MRKYTRLKGQAKRAQTQKRKEEHIMEKTTLKKIITVVRQLEIKKSINDSQFEFYSKKKRRIEHKQRAMQNEIINFFENNPKIIIKNNNESSEAKNKYLELERKKDNYKEQTKTILASYYNSMDIIENENKVINNQIKQYLINYIIISFVEKLNKLKTFNYKKLDKLISDISTEANKIHNFHNYNSKLIFKENNEYIPSWLYISIDKSNNNIYFLNDYEKYFNSHLTKKTITKKFSIDDFNQFIKWDIKAVNQEAQEQSNIEAELNSLKSKIEKLINDYNQECKKLTINKDNYNYLILR